MEDVNDDHHHHHHHQQQQQQQQRHVDGPFLNCRPWSQGDVYPWWWAASLSLRRLGILSQTCGKEPAGTQKPSWNKRLHSGRIYMEAENHLFEKKTYSKPSFLGSMLIFKGVGKFNRCVNDTMESPRSQSQGWIQLCFLYIYIYIFFWLYIQSVYKVVVQ